MNTPSRPPGKIGLALGSGSARGLAHIGVLRALKEADIDIDVVAGSSMGAVIGAAFAAGEMDGLARKFRDFDWKRVVSLIDPVFPTSGLINGQNIADFVRAQVPVANIEHLPIPFRAVATDIMNGQEVAIAVGDLIEAVRASIAVPGIFTPVRSNGRILVDGGLINPVPVSVARAMGADLVIAVDLNHDIVTGRLSRPASPVNAKPHAQAMARLLASLQPFESPALAQFDAWLRMEPLPGIFDVLLASIYIMQARITEARLLHDRPEILIRPPLGAVRFMEFARAEEIIENGYQSAARQMATLPLDTARWLKTRAHFRAQGQFNGCHG